MRVPLVNDFLLRDTVRNLIDNRLISNCRLNKMSSRNISGPYHFKIESLNVCILIDDAEKPI